MSREKIFNTAKSNFRRFLGAIWNDIASIHDRAGENGSEAGFSKGSNRFKGALGIGIKKVVLADGGNTAANRLNASEQRSSVEMLRTKHLSAAIDAFQPRHQFEVFPYSTQENLIKMCVRVN